ncbi:cysteine hydrolase family protein [Longispora sp. NPDC051575]|uniref:cysteine hydrolase family protein n=1 Tax=Longispora sp. NPDC051575 TaxID=3154943 RepID=UPI00342784E1
MTKALLIIDVQNEYVTGALPITYPPLSVSLPNIAAAMDAATAAGHLVVVVRHTESAAAPIFAEGTPGWTLVDAVADRPHDHLIDKTWPSAFTGTNLAEWLAAHDVDTVTIAGYMTQHCDESTAREAFHRGLAVEVLSDATGTLDLANEAGRVTAEELHRAMLVALHAGFAAVRTTADWIAGGEAVRSNIVASTRVAP